MRLISVTNFATKISSKIEPLQTIRNWLDSLESRDRKLAEILCQLIPASCPFERDIGFHLLSFFEAQIPDEETSTQLP